MVSAYSCVRPRKELSTNENPQRWTAQDTQKRYGCREDATHLLCDENKGKGEETGDQGCGLGDVCELGIIQVRSPWSNIVLRNGRRKSIDPTGHGATI